VKPGVNIYGYVFAESGVGEHTRLLVDSVREAGIEYSVIPFTTTLSRQETAFGDFGSGAPDYDVNIIGVNADQMDVFVEHFGPEALEGRYNIALWAWEIEDFPDWMAASARWVDEIWANSSFSARAIARKVSCPVFPFPLPIRTPNPPARSRYELGLPESFLFLFCFDFDSVFERKNPLGVVEAFKTAFPSGKGVHLLLKSINGDRHPEQRKLLETVVGCGSVAFRDGYVTSEEQDCLMNSCDTYVSLHRAEGFGLTLAEAMALGKVVIATGYSGNLDFMNEQNGWLVPFEEVPIGPGSEPYPPSARWAEPDLEMASRVMQQLVKNPEDAWQRAMRARREVPVLHGPQARSRFVAKRLADIR
jgi:glycosyltransferase involved in cell wall biosynthesis